MGRSPDSTWRISTVPFPWYIDDYRHCHAMCRLIPLRRGRCSNNRVSKGCQKNIKGMPKGCVSKGAVDLPARMNMGYQHGASALGNGPGLQTLRLGVLKSTSSRKCGVEHTGFPDVSRIIRRGRARSRSTCACHGWRDIAWKRAPEHYDMTGKT